MKHRITIKPFAYSLALLAITLIVSCKPSQATAERTQALNNLETILNSKDFKIDIHTALPYTTRATTQVLNQLMRNTGNTANRITVSGYDITVKNDSISGQLPYYGEQQLSSGSYNGNMGIVFNDKPQSLTLTKHKKRDAYIIKFNINDTEDPVETYRITITVFSNSTADVNIIPSHRNGISYKGQLISNE